MGWGAAARVTELGSQLHGFVVGTPRPSFPDFSAPGRPATVTEQAEPEPQRPGA